MRLNVISYLTNFNQYIKGVNTHLISLVVLLKVINDALFVLCAITGKGYKVIGWIDINYIMASFAYLCNLKCGFSYFQFYMLEIQLGTLLHSYFV